MRALFQNILTASLHGGILILAVCLLRLLLGKAAKKYVCVLWLLAVFRLLVPFTLESRLSIQPGPQTMVRLVTETRQAIPQTQQQTGFFADAAVTQEDAASLPEDGRAPVPGWREVLPWVWLAGTIGFGIYGVLSWLRIKRRVRLAVKTCGVWECSGIETAFVFGFFRPRIYVPSGMEQEDLCYMLAHERAHIKSGDHWAKLLGYLALGLHWFNPLVWLGYFYMGRDMELACDQRVVQDMTMEERKRYCAALLRCSAGRDHFAACPVAFGEGNVKQRILGVLSYRQPKFWLSLIGVAAVVFVAVCLLPGPAKEDRAIPEEPELIAEPTESRQAAAEQAEPQDGDEAYRERYPRWLYEKDGRLWFRGKDGNIDITDSIDSDTPFTYIFVPQEEGQLSIYVAVGGNWNGTASSIGWGSWEREYGSNQTAWEGWLGGSATNHIDNAADAEYGWFTAAKQQLGIPYP